MVAGGRTDGGSGSHVGRPQISISTLADSVSLFFFFFFDNFDLKLRRETTVGGGGDELRRLCHGGLRQRDSSDPRIRERFQG